MYAEAIEFIDVDGNSTYKDVFCDSLSIGYLEGQLPRVIVFHQDLLRKIGRRDFLSVCEMIGKIEYHTEGINYFISNGDEITSYPLTLYQLMRIFLERNGILIRYPEEEE